MHEAKKMDENGNPECWFSTPKKYKKDKRVTCIDGFDKCVEHTTVHEFDTIEKKHLSVLNAVYIV